MLNYTLDFYSNKNKWITTKHNNMDKSKKPVFWKLNKTKETLNKIESNGYLWVEVGMG